MLTQVEFQFFESAPRVLRSISNSLERIACVLERMEQGDKPQRAEHQPEDKENETQTEHSHKISYCEGLSARVLNVFRGYGIETVEEAAQFSKDAYGRARALGAKSVREIEAMLAEYGMEFGERQRLVDLKRELDGQN